jgi:hypothetical protein
MPIQLPEMPFRIRRLPRDERGYPVPRFVQWFVDGENSRSRRRGASPDFRYADQEFRWRAFHNGHCWVCGDPLGVHKVYAIGPMCVVNRITSEPAGHRECMEWSVQACPFLIHPRQKRDRKDLDERARSPGGIMIDRNPGCVCLYETALAKAFNDGTGDWLIKLDTPSRVDWWAGGRKATRAEILDSIDSGFPILFDLAKREGTKAVEELNRMRVAAMTLLPAA